jgi:hypothetical protein
MSDFQTSVAFGRVPANDQTSMNVSFYQNQTFIR